MHTHAPPPLGVLLFTPEAARARCECEPRDRIGVIGAPHLTKHMRTRCHSVPCATLPPLWATSHVCLA